MTSIWSTKWAKDGLVAKTISFLGAHWIKSVEEVRARCSCMLRTISVLLSLRLQGAATTIYAVVTEDLASHSGAYLVDCKLHEPHKAALDAELASKLWTVTEQQLQAAAQG